MKMIGRHTDTSNAVRLQTGQAAKFDLDEYVIRCDQPILEVQPVKG
jgi:hypothetical protein